MSIVMSVIEDVYEDLDVDIDEEAFRSAVEEKVEKMAGLADTETAAQLVARELGDSTPDTISAIEPGPKEVSFAGKVSSVGELRTFERDDGGDGRVLNIEVADETGRIRVALWDDRAVAAREELEPGAVVRIKGHPKEGYNGIEVSASRIEGDPDTEIDVSIDGTTTIDQLSMGQSDVTISGRVLATEPVRTFSRDDGSEGRVSNLVVGDETGRVRLTLWDEQADSVEDHSVGESIEIIDGYVRERDGALELHVGSRGAIEPIEQEIQFVPDSTPIDALEMGETVDIAGVIRSSDPKRTFERDDGSDGQVRNVRVQDQTDDIRVALWGEKADIDLAPGDEALFADVEIQDGWKDSIEASAGWQSTVSVLDDGTTLSTDDNAETETTNTSNDGSNNTLASFSDSDETTTASSDSEAGSDTEHREFTGTVVQTGEPVILDNGQTTLSVTTDEDVHLGEEITVRGRIRDDQLHADDVL